MAHVAFDAPCPNGHPARWSASCPMSVTDRPIVSYDIRCPRCTNAERHRNKWCLEKRI